MDLFNSHTERTHLVDEALIVVYRNNEQIYLAPHKNFRLKRFALEMFATHGPIRVFVKQKGVVWREFGWKSQTKGTIHKRPRLKAAARTCPMFKQLEMFSMVGDMQ